MSSNIIELDIWSKFGCFSKSFSNSGGILTYFIPPKTSIIGLVGAVLGYRFDDFALNGNNDKIYTIEKLNDIKISIQPLFSLNTKRVTFNRVSENAIMNIHQDVLINPYYKIYIKFPDNLKDEEELFIQRIKDKQSVFNLYMGRNEFLLNYELKNIIESEKFILDNSNRNEFFDSNNKIYGSLNRKNVKSTALKSEKVNVKRSLFSKNTNSKSVDKLESYFEYLISDYPIKREHFVDFTYAPVSFYTMNKNENCYFSDISLKNDSSLELFKIGDKRWISLI